MTDSDIRRWLQQQTKHEVGHVSLNSIRDGKASEALLEQASNGKQLVVCDAVSDNDLITLGQAVKDLPLITGGSGIAMALPGLLTQDRSAAQKWVGEQGLSLVVSGSCSEATRRQIKQHAVDCGAQLKLNTALIIEKSQTPADVLDWAEKQTGLPLVYTSDDPEQVKLTQDRFGAERSAAAIEEFFGELAALAVGRGYRRIISAGGETSGAVVNALGVHALEIGPVIDPGVPALRVQGQSLVLALKSGNFGAPDFFLKADKVLAG